MPVLVLLGGVAVAGAAGAALVLAREGRKLTLPFAPDEFHWARTSDGWRLPLGRYLPRGARAVAEPVILCHGMGANRYNLDFDERHSVARYLAARGFECFVVELRGSGLAYRPDRDRARRWRFNFDDYVRADLPAIVETVRGISGAARVLWVGHSKGGIVMYAYCATAPRPEIAGVVAIGSPAAFPHFTGVSRALLSRGHHLLLHDSLWSEPFLRWLAPLGGRGVIRMHWMASHANMEPEVTAFAMRNLLGNISRDVLRQFSRWIRTGAFDSFDGRIDYRAGLAQSTVPFLLIAGSADRLVHPEAVAVARDAMVAARDAGDVDYVVAGKANGFRADYGHGDLVLGRLAPDEIFPRVEQWLRARGSAPRARDVAPGAPDVASITRTSREP